MTVHREPVAASPVAAAVRRAARLLPDQGPIRVFVHHNPLHALEDLPFAEAVRLASARVGAEPRLPEAEYRAALASGRIAPVDLAAAHDAFEAGRADADRPTVAGRAARALRAALLRTGVEVEPAATRQHRVREGLVPADGPLAVLRGRCERWADDLRIGPPAAEPPPPRCPPAVEDLLVPAVAAFLDLGQAPVAMPGREAGLWRAVRALWLAPGGLPPAPWTAALRARLEAARDPEQVVADALAGVAPPERERFLARLLHELPGWAGMVSRRERGLDPGPPATLVDWLALRLALGAALPPAPAPTPAPPEPLADRLACALHGCGVAPEALEDAAPDVVRAAFDAVAAFDPLARREVLHEAYERTRIEEWLAALAARPVAPPPAAARWLVLTCIDEREESFRRAVEEALGPAVETAGVAGFFGVAVRFRGARDPEESARGPVGARPAHLVREIAPDDLGRRLFAGWARLAHAAGVASRGALGGALASALLALPAALAVALSTALPGLLPAPRRAATRLLALREEVDEGLAPAEAAERIAGLLAAHGLSDRLAPVVALVGHGATCANNPHRSAYQCGACGGFDGAANARLVAELANRADVRAALAARGTPIPAGTTFVGLLHDTTTDGIALVSAVPDAARAEVDALLRGLDLARARNARERMRRLGTAPPVRTDAAALRHARARGRSIAEPRPEYGHATNLALVVGRRGWTRGLVLDRRAFLPAYDPDRDPDGAALARVLGGVVPVCAGISLEYWFGRVDNRAWGCGTKLPHNVVGLLGVMDGSRSDLRTGLPLQTVEIHEPVRLLTVVDAPPERVRRALAALPEVKRLADHGWIHLFARDAEGRFHRWSAGGFARWPVAPAALPVAPDGPAAWEGRAGFLPLTVLGG